jgi:hypothetical protein
MLVFIAACSSDKIEIPEAKNAAENLIKAIDKQDYAETSNYYTVNFNQSESEQQRAEKFKQLRDVMGNMESYQLVDSTNATEPGIEASAVLTYRIKRSSINSLETFTVVYDEGNYRVANHSIKADK